MSSTSSSTILADSIGSLSSSRLIGTDSNAKRVASPFAKTYKQASQLFLTRRLPDALHVLEPLICPQRSGDGGSSAEESSKIGPAPIATATRNIRVKVWSLYLTLLNSIIELGPEDGKTQFGSTNWRAIVAKARDGSIWEEVVQAGYDGVEGNVDADVVSNL